MAALPPQLHQAAAGQGGDTEPGAAQQGQAQLHHAGEDRDDHDVEDDDHDDANVSAAHRRHAACIEGDTWPAALPATGRSMLLLLTSIVMFINETLFLYLHPCC